MKVTIEITGNHNPEDVKQILRDALGEYWRSRTPVEDYVEARYADHLDSFQETSGAP